VIELVAPMGASVVFTGEINVVAPEAEGRDIEAALQKALALVSSIGAFKSPGFGEIVHARSKLTKDSAVIPLGLPSNSGGKVGQMRYRVTFDRPVLADGDKIADNAVLGNDVIPGAVFKGALARKLELAGENPQAGPLGEALAALRISHAFPEGDTEGSRLSMPIPLSMVGVKNNISSKDQPRVLFSDMALKAQPRGELLNGEEPLFPGDWKWTCFGDAEALLNRPTGTLPVAIARTHTAINGEGVAKTGQLFTTIAKTARNKEGDHLNWIVEIDASAAGDTGSLLVAALASGVDGIGKTDARATLTPIKGADRPQLAPISGRPGVFGVMLCADTLMHDGSKTAAEGLSAKDAYHAYWNTVLPGCKLLDFFAAQKLVGGYVSRRRRAYGTGHYYPFSLTTAGSIFIIEASAADLQTRLAELVKTNLPAAPINGKQVTWRNCPYVPENGYGQISANHLSDATVVSNLRELSND
jgi:hypothetical protein